MVNAIKSKVETLEKMKEDILDTHSVDEIKAKICIMDSLYYLNKDNYEFLEEFFKIKTEIYIELKDQLTTQQQVVRNLKLEKYLATW